MKKQELHAAFANGYTSEEKDGERTYFINKQLGTEAYDAVKDVQFKLNEETGTFELDYEIMSDACGIISDFSIEELEGDMGEERLRDAADGTGSVYTATQLSYITPYNQDEISDISKECGCDISTAASVWYERQVAYACSLIRDAILEGEDEEETD